MSQLEPAPFAGTLAGAVLIGLIGLTSLISTPATAGVPPPSPGESPPAIPAPDDPSVELDPLPPAEEGDSDAPVDDGPDDGGPGPATPPRDDPATPETPLDPIAPATTTSKSGTPWLRRQLPRDNSWEVGVHLGMLFPAERHELFTTDLTRPSQGQLPFNRVAPELGLRAGYYPLRWVGLELEGSLMPTRVRGNGDPRALLWAARTHVVGQLSLWRVAPFILAGLGGMGVRSDSEVLGDDSDLAVHIGAGVKLQVLRNLAVRLDVRDTISYTCDACGLATGELTSSSAFSSHHAALLLGASAVLGPRNPRDRRPPEPQPGDRDGDGVPDPSDECVEDPETENGFQDGDGCPESDTDGDGYWDRPALDDCPDEPGGEPNGCPVRDTDGDGFMDPDDQCVQLPENENGFEDDDGCPDTMPDEVIAFTGIFRGISFATDRTDIQDQSKTALDAAVELLKKHPSLRILIVGHTDSQGRRIYNIRLSRRRAESVKRYLVSQGIDAGRLETHGVGPDEPIDTNYSTEGRRRNRRIEFEILR